MGKCTNNLTILPSSALSHSTVEVQQQILKQAEEWFHLDCANGDARQDTIKTYLSHLKQYLAWCADRGINPATAREHDIKEYREFVKKKRDGKGEIIGATKSATIKLKLTTIRRFYQCGVDRKLLESNPAKGIKAPRDRGTQDGMKHFTAGEAELLARSLPQGDSLKDHRDRAIIALELIEGLRRIEIVRANVGDIENTDSGVRILVHGKGKDAYIYPCDETVALLNAYLVLRGSILPDASGDEPMFLSFFKAGKTRKERIHRNGVSDVVNGYLRAAGIKKPGKSCHALRHSCGYFIYQATRDVKAVQDTLRHTSLAMAAKYSHTEDLARARYTRQIPVKIRRTNVL